MLQTVPTTVGRNFKTIREAKGITQEALAKQLGYKRAANVSIMESSTGIPKPTKIKRMAAALGVETWELLHDVPFPHDALRWPPNVAALVKGADSRNVRKVTKR